MITLLSDRHNRDLLVHLTLRELRSKYKRTALGWGWSMLNPLVTALIYSAVFGKFFRIQAPRGNPSGLTNFTFYLLAGLLPWGFAANGITSCMAAIIGNAGLIQKVKFRREVLVLSAAFAAAITLLIEMSVLAVALWALAHRLTLKFLPAVVVLVALQTIFVAGIGLALSALNVYLRDLSYLTNLGLMAWMYLTPVIYSITLVPVNGWLLGHRWPLRRLIRLNPMTRFVGAYRECLYDLRFPSGITWVFLVISSVLTMVLGSLIFGRLQGRFAEEL